MNFPGARHLTDVDGDEVSLVKRAANRRRFLLTKSDEGIDPELADFLSVPAAGEGALLDEVRKDGGDETAEMAVAAAMRLLTGVQGDLSRETIAKLGTALYPRTNMALNTDQGAAGKPLNMSDMQSEDLDGTFANDENWDGDEDEDDLAVGKDDDGDADDVMKRSVSTSERKNLADKGEANSDGSFPIASKGDLKNAIQAFGRSKNPGKTKALIIRRAKALGATSMLPESWNVSKSTDDNEGGAPVETPTPVPIRKEDGSWDFSGVPAEARPYYESLLKQADDTAAELEATKEKLQKADETTATLAEALKTREFIAKAETELPNVGPSDKVALILKAASESFDEDTFTELQTILKANNEKIATGDLFAELGRTSRGEDAQPSSAYQEAVAKADEIVAKGDGVAKDVALGMVWEQNPGLYDRYIAEKPSLRSLGNISPASFARQGGDQ